MPAVEQTGIDPAALLAGLNGVQQELSAAADAAADALVSAMREDRPAYRMLDAITVQRDDDTTRTLTIPAPSAWRIRGFPATGGAMVWLQGKIIPIETAGGIIFRRVTAQALAAGKFRYPEGDDFLSRALASPQFKGVFDAMQTRISALLAR